MSKDQMLLSSYLWDMPNISFTKLHNLISNLSPSTLEKNTTPEALAIKVILKRANNLSKLKEFFSEKEFKKIQKFHEKLMKTNSTNISGQNEVKIVKIQLISYSLDRTDPFHKMLNMIKTHGKEIYLPSKSVDVPRKETTLIEQEIINQRNKEIIPTRIPNPLKFAKI